MKKSFKKVLSFAMILVLCLGILSGCGEKGPTAESLVNGAFGAETLTSVSTKALISYNMLISEDGTDPFNMNMKMDVTLDVNEAGETHQFGDVTAEYLGISKSEKIDCYEIIDGDDFKYYYEYGPDAGNWSVSTTDALSGKGIINSFAALANTNAFEDGSLILVKANEDDAVYTVTGTANVAAAGMSFLTDFIELGTDSASGLVMNATMQFDKETKLLKSVELVLNHEKTTKEIVDVFNEFAVSFEINKINDVSVEVPADVVAGAVDVNTLYGVDEPDLEGIDDLEMLDGESSVDVVEGVEEPAE